MAYLINFSVVLLLLLQSILELFFKYSNILMPGVSSTIHLFSSLFWHVPLFTTITSKCEFISRGSRVRFSCRRWEASAALGGGDGDRARPVRLAERPSTRAHRQEPRPLPRRRPSLRLATQICEARYNGATIELNIMYSVLSTLRVLHYVKKHAFGE